MRAAARTALLVLAASLAASGCRKELSEPVVESIGSDVMTQLSGDEVRVDCPSGIEMRAQENFFCRTFVADRTGWLLVRQLDDYGRVELARELPLDREQVEGVVFRYLLREHGVDGEVTCPYPIIQEPDENFTCSVDGEPDADVRQVDGVDEYEINWRGDELARNP